jgi:hypothetical protein
MVWRNRKKISQIINDDYLCLQFFLLIILLGTLYTLQIHGPQNKRTVLKSILYIGQHVFKSIFVMIDTFLLYSVNLKSLIFNKLLSS